jgi:DNA-binding transcriptional LysR family regulator
MSPDAVRHKRNAAALFSRGTAPDELPILGCRRHRQTPCCLCVELRHLRYFVAVGEELSFTRAAEKLHLAQPSLSRQIQDLEEELGVRLLNRTRQGVSLTNSGKSFLADARRVVSHGEEIMQSVRELDREEKRNLRVGYAPDLMYDLLPSSLAPSKPLSRPSRSSFST